MLCYAMLCYAMLCYAAARKVASTITGQISPRLFLIVFGKVLIQFTDYNATALDFSIPWHLPKFRNALTA
jgi:hypothetical protein